MLTGRDCRLMFQGKATSVPKNEEEEDEEEEEE